MELKKAALSVGKKNKVFFVFNLSRTYEYDRIIENEVILITKGCNVGGQFLLKSHELKSKLTIAFSVCEIRHQVLVLKQTMQYQNCRVFVVINRNINNSCNNSEVLFVRIMYCTRSMYNIYASVKGKKA